jgi:hypothetical protein
MSRNFNGSSDYLTRGDRLSLSAYPFSFFAWFKGDTFATNNRTLVGVYEDGGSYTNLAKLAVKTDSTIELAVFDGGFKTATTSATASTGAWQSAAAVFASNASRSVYVNGAGKVTNTTADTMSIATLSRFSVGAFTIGPPSEFFDGLIGYVGVYNVALSDGNVTSLNGGAALNSVAGLVGHYRLIANTNPEPDDANDFDLTVIGATHSTDNPTISAGGAAAAHAYYRSMLVR